MTDLTIRNATHLACTPTMRVCRVRHVGHIGGLGANVTPGMVNPHADLPTTLGHGLGEDTDDHLYLHRAGCPGIDPRWRPHGRRHALLRGRGGPDP